MGSLLSKDVPTAGGPKAWGPVPGRWPQAEKARSGQADLRVLEGCRCELRLSPATARRRHHGGTVQRVWRGHSWVALKGSSATVPRPWSMVGAILGVAKHLKAI